MSNPSSHSTGPVEPYSLEAFNSLSLSPQLNSMESNDHMSHSNATSNPGHNLSVPQLVVDTQNIST